MAVVRWEPWTGLNHLHNMMDNLISDAFGGNSRWYAEGERFNYLPVDVKETGDGYEVCAPIAGVKPEDVEVTFSDGLLTIRATRREESEKKEGNYLRREVFTGGYYRQIALPGEVRADDIKADVEDGILKVHIPREKKPEPRKIPVGGTSNSKKIAASS